MLLLLVRRHPVPQRQARRAQVRKLVQLVQLVRGERLGVDPDALRLLAAVRRDDHRAGGGPRPRRRVLLLLLLLLRGARVRLCVRGCVTARPAGAVHPNLRRRCCCRLRLHVHLHRWWPMLVPELLWLVVVVALWRRLPETHLALDGRVLGPAGEGGSRQGLHVVSGRCGCPPSRRGIRVRRRQHLPRELRLLLVVLLQEQGGRSGWCHLA
jgi:hypothetical protein